MSVNNVAGMGVLRRAERDPRDQVWYVCHPLRPTAEELVAVRDCEFGVVDDVRVATRVNLDRALRWLAWLRRTFPEVTFIAPWIAAVLSGEDDADPVKRANGLRDDCRVVRRCDGVVLCGGRVSEGMALERDRAEAVADLTALGGEPPRDGA